MSQAEKQEPTVITLDNQNSLQILAQYVEVAQQKGAYVLQEADILKRSVEVVLNNVPDQEIDATQAKQLLIQGVNKGQRHGAYTLNDASVLNKVVQYVISSDQTLQQPPQQPQPQPSSSSDDLTDLAEPIPLKPKEV